MITPLLKKYKGGTLVTFQSSSEDMTFLTGGTNSRKMRFSKFALLKIPPILQQQGGQNSIQFENIEGHFNKGLSTATPPIEGKKFDISESLQNYLLNLESLIISGDNYDRDNPLTVSERVFFKWLKEIGAIRWREATTSEKHSSVSEKLFVEEDENSDPTAAPIYEKVIRYVGEIDMDGNARSKYNSFKEVYIYVPTENGETPVVLFKTMEDSNYYKNMVIRREPNDPNKEYINGRTISDDPTFANLTVQAFYDMDVPLNYYQYLVNNDPNQNIWFYNNAGNGPNAYFTDQVFDDPSNDLIKRTDISTGNTVEYLRSRLDGVSIEFNTEKYSYFRDNNLKYFAEYNKQPFTRSFSFNTIMLYYDVYEKDDQGNEVVVATNLFGVLFLKDLEVISGGGTKIGDILKTKPNSISGEYGNGYSMRLNLKQDVSADSVNQIEVETTVNPYNTFSLQLFSEALNNMLLTNKNYEELSLKLAEYSELMRNSLNINDYQYLRDKINNLEQILLQNYSDPDNISQIVSENRRLINDILKGNTTVGVNFLLDIITDGTIKADLVGSTLMLKNNTNKYSITSEININLNSDDNILKLPKGTGYFYHKNDGLPKIASLPIIIKFDDRDNQWSTGKSVVIDIIDDIDFGNMPITFLTDSTNKTGNTLNYSINMGTLFIKNGVKTPRIEIICLSDELKDFNFIIKQI